MISIKKLQQSALPLSTFFMNGTSILGERGGAFRSRVSFSGFRFVPRVTLPLVAALLLIVGIISFFVGMKVGSSNPRIIVQDNRESAPGAKAKDDINKTFVFGLKDEKGKEVANFKYILQNAQLQDEILIKGQKARAVKGKTFLILDIKIDNQNKQGIQINTRDYIRLSVNGGKEWLAPEIHNDPVQAQAISTKYTRVGFPISDVDTDKLEIQIGEINGKKEIIKPDLK